MYSIGTYTDIRGLGCFTEEWRDIAGCMAVWRSTRRIKRARMRFVVM